MHIKKYDFDYSRRFFMDKMAKGAMGAGVLSSMMPLVGNTGDISKAYPEELTNIEAFTKGKIKTGDIVDANNVEYVKDILDPVAYIQIVQQGRRIPPSSIPATTSKPPCAIRAWAHLTPLAMLSSKIPASPGLVAHRFPTRKPVSRPLPTSP